MSTGTTLPYHVAYNLGEKIARQLRPHAARVKAVGSLRRRRPTVGDLEFLVEPRMVEVDLFGTLEPQIEPLRAVMRELGTWVKGGDRMMQITDCAGVAGLKLELYVVHPPAQWGSILAIRTGPAALSHEAMNRLRTRGYRHDYGSVLRGWDVVPTPTEEAFFALADLPCVAPARRDALADELEHARTHPTPARRA